MPVESKTGCALHQSADLSTRVILRQLRQFFQVHVALHDLVLTHLGSMNVQNLQTTVLIWETNFHVNFETSRAEERLINHVKPVCHTNDEDIVELIDTIQLGGKRLFRA